MTAKEKMQLLPWTRIKKNLVCTVEFDPTRRAGKQNALLTFLQDAGDLDDLTKVPFIGPRLKNILATRVEPQITTVYQLMGRFLQFQRKDIPQEWWCQSMFKFLVEIGAGIGYAQRITRCLAELLDLYFPGLYDLSRFGRCDVSEFVELPSAKLPDGSGPDLASCTVPPDPITTLFSDANCRTSYDYANDLWNMLDIRLPGRTMGFGKKSLTNLAERHITSVYQLYGAFLSLRTVGISKEQWLNVCYQWCKINGIVPRYCPNIAHFICETLEDVFDIQYEDREAAREELCTREWARVFAASSGATAPVTVKTVEWARALQGFVAAYPGLAAFVSRVLLCYYRPH